MPSSSSLVWSGQQRRSRRSVCEIHEYGSVRGAPGDRRPYSRGPRRCLFGLRPKSSAHMPVLAGRVGIVFRAFLPAFETGGGSRLPSGSSSVARLPVTMLRSSWKRPFGERRRGAVGVAEHFELGRQSGSWGRGHSCVNERPSRWPSRDTSCAPAPCGAGRRRGTRAADRN